MDRTKGVPCPVTRETLCRVDRPNAETKKYKKFKDSKEDHKIIERQTAKRAEWLQKHKYW